MESKIIICHNSIDHISDDGIQRIIAQSLTMVFSKSSKPQRMQTQVYGQMNCEFLTEKIIESALNRQLDKGHTIYIACTNQLLGFPHAKTFWGLRRFLRQEKTKGTWFVLLSNNLITLASGTICGFSPKWHSNRRGVS